MGKLRVATNSYQNIVLLVLLVIGLLVLYRYIKNVETDTKVLNNNIIELSKKIQILSKNIQDENTVCMREQVSGEKNPIINSEKNEEVKRQQCDTILENVDEDNESIHSEDITNMLQKVMGGVVSPEFDEIDVIINNIQQDYVITNNDNDIPKSRIEIIEDTDEQEEVREIETQEDNHDIDDDIVITKPSEKDELLKKTNEELKNILKDKGLQTKGNKTELVDRILSNA